LPNCLSSEGEALFGIDQNRTKNRRFNVPKSEAYRKELYTISTQAKYGTFLPIISVVYTTYFFGQDDRIRTCAPHTVTGATAKSRRTRHIPLNREATSVLTNWRAQCEDLSGLVFVNDAGVRFDRVNFSWRRLLKDAGISDFRWHDMRHHFASRLAMGGVDLNTIRELLGHSDYTMTLRYAHLAPEFRMKAVEVLDEAREKPMGGGQGFGLGSIFGYRDRREHLGI
jgi:Phage integrase family